MSWRCKSSLGKMMFHCSPTTPSTFSRYWWKSEIKVRIGREGFPDGTTIKNLPCNAGDMGDAGSVPGLGRSPGGGCGNPLQYSCLNNFLDRGTWQGIVHGITESRTRLSEHAKPTLNFPHQGGTLVTLNESTLTHHIHSACYGSLLVVCVLWVWING